MLGVRGRPSTRVEAAVGSLAFEPLDVGEVLRPAGSPLVPDEVLPGENRDRLPGEASGHPVSVGVFKRDTVDVGQDVDSNRRHFDLEDDARCAEILDGQAVQRRAEGLEGMDHPRRILRLRSNPYVQVLRGANVAVRGQRVSTDDQELDVTGVEFLNEISEVLVHRSRPSSIGRRAV